MEELFLSEGIELGELIMQPFTLRQTEKPLFILEYAWKPLLEMLEYTFRESTNELHAKQALHNIQKLIKIGGTVHQTATLQKVIESLCAWKVPDDLNECTWRNGYKYIHIYKTIIDTTKKHYKLLNEENWLTILQSLERLNQCITKNEAIQQQLDSILYEVTKKVPRINHQEELVQITNKELSLDKYGNDSMLSPFPERANLPSRAFTPKADKEEPSFGRDLSRLSEGQISKKMEFRLEVEKLKEQLDSIFAFTSLFDVLIPILS